AVVNRSEETAAVDIQTARSIESISDGSIATATMRIQPDNLAVTTIKPGGFLIVSSGQLTSAAPNPTLVGAGPTISVAPAIDPDPDPTHIPAAGVPSQVSYISNRTDLRLLRDPNRELVLLRTRRADGVPYTDPNTVYNGSDPSGYRRPAFSERLGTPE